MNENPELKPCPFCPKGKGQWQEYNARPLYWVTCDKCGVSTEGSHNKEKAIKQWNDRVAPEPTEVQS